VRTKLPDDDLQDILPRVIHAGFWKEDNKDTVEKAVQLIISGYEKLRKEYYEGLTNNN
jgi:hypothetical protein